MPDFEIKISTPADLSGAQATQAIFTALSQQAATVAASAAQAAGQEQGAAQAAAALGSAAAQAGQAHFKPLADSANEAKTHLSEAEHEADHLLSTLKTGVSIDIGHRIVEGVAEIPRAFQEAIAEGVHFNAEMETLGIQLGGALRSANPGQYLNFTEARAAGEETLEKLRVKANELGTSFQALSETFAINAPLLSHAGIKGIQAQIDTIILLNQVAQAHGVSGFQAQRDIIDILNGNGNRTQLGRELESNGVTNESIKQAEEMGTLMDLLRDKLGAYGEAGKAAADTFTASQQRLRNETEQLYGEISKPVFDELKQAYDSLAAEIVKPEVSEALRGLGFDIASVVSAGSSLINFAVENAGVLVPLGTAIGVVTFALSAYKAAQIASIIGERLTALVAETEATAAQTAAITEQTAAIEANTVAKAADAEAGAVGGPGAAVGEGELTAGQAAGGVIAAAVAGYTAYEAGRAIRKSHDDQQSAAEQDHAEVVSKRTDNLNKMVNDAESAQTPEAQQKALGAISTELAQAYDKLKQINTVIARDKPTLTPLDKEKIDDLKEYITLLEVANREAQKLAGTKPLADADAKKRADALAAYYNSPEYLLEQAKASGDQGKIDDAQYNLNVSKRVPKLEKEGLSPEDAEREAQKAESADEDSKERDKDAKDEEALRKRAQGEADAWSEKDKRETEADEKKAAAVVQQAAAEAKQREDALAAEREEIAISQARARGEKDVADQLEKQRDIRIETTRLQGQGVGYAEAHALAELKINADNDAQDRADANRAAGRRGTGQADRTIYGYSDPDTDGHLHGGSLGTSSQHHSPTTTDLDPGGGIHGGGLGPGDAAATSTAGAALANPLIRGARAFGDPSAALADPAAHAFDDPLKALANPTASGFADPIAIMNAAVKTAASQLAPVASSLSTPGASGTNTTSGGGALAGVDTSATSTKSSLDALTTAANAAATALSTIKGGAGGGFDWVGAANAADDADDDLTGQVASLSAGF